MRERSDGRPANLSAAGSRRVLRADGAPGAWIAARPQRAKPEGGRAANGGDVGRRAQEERREPWRVVGGVRWRARKGPARPVERPHLLRRRLTGGDNLVTNRAPKTAKMRVYRQMGADCRADEKREK